MSGNMTSEIWQIWNWLVCTWCGRLWQVLTFPQAPKSKKAIFHSESWSSTMSLHQEIWESQAMSYNPRWSLIRPYITWFDLIRSSPRIIWHYLVPPNFLMTKPPLSSDLLIVFLHHSPILQPLSSLYPICYFPLKLKHVSALCYIFLYTPWFYWPD